MSGRAKIGYWAKIFGFTCQECYEYMLEEFLRCPLQIKLRELREAYEIYDTIGIPESKPGKPILKTYLADFTSDFNKSKILRERKTRELKTDEEIQYEELLAEKRKIEDKIQKCLNRQHYLAVVKRERRFRDQELRIADCRSCENYWAEFDFCWVNYELKNRRGVCQSYKFGCTIDNIQRRWQNE